MKNADRAAHKGRKRTDQSSYAANLQVVLCFPTTWVRVLYVACRVPESSITLNGMFSKRGRWIKRPLPRWPASCLARSFLNFGVQTNIDPATWRLMSWITTYKRFDCLKSTRSRSPLWRMKHYRWRCC